MIADITIPENNLGNYIMPEDCKTDVCVDIGANVGSFVMSYCDRFETLHFYEPYKPCFEVVKQKSSGKANVIGYNEAVYSEDNKVVEIVSHDNKHAGSNAIKTDSINNHWNRVLHSVTTVSLPTVLNRVGGYINYLKCDCETSEYYFFIDKDLSRIDYISIELHWQMGKERFDSLVNYIRKTHVSNTENIEWAEESNPEILFKNKKLS